jgi:hypothetical protein
MVDSSWNQSATWVKLGSCPLSNFVDRGQSGIAVQRLSVQQVLVAKRDGVSGQLIELVPGERYLDTVLFEDVG